MDFVCFRLKMVHKKTEYRLQFQLLAKDLRKQIWQDNIQFRYILDTFNHFINCHAIEGAEQSLFYMMPAGREASQKSPQGEAVTF